MQKQDFKKLFEHGPVILDGATGSNLMKAGMPKGVCTEKWVLEHPDTIDPQDKKQSLLFFTAFLECGTVCRRLSDFPQHFQKERLHTDR